MTIETLVIFGGNSVSDEPWPQWPTPIDLMHESRLKEVFESGVWAISGRSNGQRLQCQQFREEFAGGWQSVTGHPSATGHNLEGGDTSCCCRVAYAAGSGERNAPLG